MSYTSRLIGTYFIDGNSDAVYQNTSYNIVSLNGKMNAAGKYIVSGFVGVDAYSSAYGKYTEVDISFVRGTSVLQTNDVSLTSVHVDESAGNMDLGCYYTIPFMFVVTNNLNYSANFTFKVEFKARNSDIYLILRDSQGGVEKIQ